MSWQDPVATILTQYQQSFSSKEYREENNDIDELMGLFDLTPDLKRENRQYWGRELGMCWQLMLSRLFAATTCSYEVAIREEDDELCDFVNGGHAIDTKYRVGSGDSGFQKKVRDYGKRIVYRGKRPLLLVLREDNLPSAIKAFAAGGWEVLIGADCFRYIQEHTKVDLRQWMQENKSHYSVQR